MSKVLQGSKKRAGDKVDNIPQVYPIEVLNGLAGEFYNYFLRKRDRIEISPRQARMMVDYVAGPSAGRGGSSSKSIALTQGTGTGYARPTKEQIDAIFNRHYHDLDYEAWDAVFDEVMEKNKKRPNIIELIHLTFRDKHGTQVICEELCICESTFFRYRRIILEQVVHLSYKKALLTLANA